MHMPFEWTPIGSFFAGDPFQSSHRNEFQETEVFKRALLSLYLVFTPCLLEVDSICLCFPDGQALCPGATG
jgi:hypothetical protein